MAAPAPPSPDSLQLRGAPLASARLSKKAALFAVGTLALILGVIIVNVSKKPPKKEAEENAPQKTLEPALNAAKTLTKDVPDIVAPPLQMRAREPASTSAPVKNSEDDARLADSAVTQFATTEANGTTSFAGNSQTESTSTRNSTNNSTSNNTNVNNNSRRVANGLFGLAGEEPGSEPDLNRQADKQAFLEKNRKSAYLGNSVRQPVSPFELKTGTVIPSILVSELNSDLPGEIIAQVSQNVYDTASGNHLLIPQGTKLFGHYDSQVAFGQERVLVSWQRLIFPDASTLELDGMSGHDQAGNAGLADRVNNHYARIFGGALLTSLLSAGYQLSQNQNQNAFQVPSNSQVAAAAVGQQVAEVGLEVARRNLRVQPTIEIRKGYRLNVMVNKDVVFAGDYQR